MLQAATAGDEPMAATAETTTKPTQPLDPGFPRGPFHIAKAKGAGWRVGLRPHFEYRDLGIEGATAGKVLAQVIRARQPCDGPGDEHTHDLDFQMVYVLKGWMKTTFEGVGERTLEAGDCMYQKPGIRHRVVGYSDDLEVLEITIPADFETETTAR
jgi:mannose-6-phosphate isomerase-like protein (cupin superfamily)